MPFDVRLILPSRKALLFETPDHDRQPGIKVWDSSLTYSSASMVCGLLITTLFLSSTSLPPKPHRRQCIQVSLSPVAWLSAKPGGWPFLLSAWHSFKKPWVSVGILSKPASLTHDTRQFSSAPPAPSGRPIHLPLLVAYFFGASYQPPYLSPR